MNFSLFTIPIFLFLVAIIPSSFSQDSSVTDNGFFGVEQNTYILKYGDEFQIVKISGIGEMSQGDGRAKAVITITNPDSTENSHRIIAGSDGYFELTFPLYYHSQTGTYKAFATFERYVLGEVFFTVERLSITESDTKSNSSNDEQEHVFEFKTSTFEVATDSTTYQKGEIIHIIGVVPTQPNLDLTLQITNPLNNRVLINQITPNPDGTFEDSVNTSGSLWNSEGDYNIRINYNGQDLYSTFSFSIPTEIAVPNPIEISPEPPKIQEPEVIVQEPVIQEPVIQNPTPAITSPPPQPATIQESDEFDPTGIILFIIIIGIIIIIKKRKKSPKQNSYQRQEYYKSDDYSDDNSYHSTENLKTYYEILELPENASKIQIKNAYRELIKFYHPDMHQNNPEKLARAEKKTKQITEAYEKLKNAGKV